MHRCSLIARALLLFVVSMAVAGCAPSSTEDPSSTNDSAADTGRNNPSGDNAAAGATTAADRENNADPIASDDAVPEVAVPEAAVPADSPESPTLTIGDPAPSLAIAKWMKGNPVEAFDNGQIYVVEFWATWCGPCRSSMPHISQLQTDYGRDVTFVGVSDESEETVQSFFDEVQDPENGTTWNDAITYTIALDDADENTGQAYMRAAQQNGIPTAFVVGRDGHIEWIGHPMRLDEPLSKIVGGDWDRAAAIAEFKSQQKIKEVTRQLQQALGRARSTGDWSELRQIIAEAGDAGAPPAMVRSLKFDVAVLSKSFDEANALADELASASWDDAQQLNTLAWNLVTRVPREGQNHEQALRIALRASELTDEKDGSILDTVARVYYEAGDLEQAVAWQRKAVEQAPAGLAQIQDTLEKYESELAPSSAGPESQTPE